MEFAETFHAWYCMLPSLILKLKNRWPPERWAGMTIVVGCSGGADSVALLRATHALRPANSTLVVAHYNHRLRGLESDEDEKFVASLAQSLQSTFVSNSIVDPIEPQASALNVSSTLPRDEASLREIRYQFLLRVAQTNGARYVAVAHTADDSIETVLHNLVRGTGLSGLTGIAAHRDLNQDLVLIRPLIDVWRHEVVGYLKQIQQAFRQDSSNDSCAYTRNRIRHRLLPVIEEEFGADAKTAIHRSSSILAELHQWLQSEAERWLEQVVVLRTPRRVELRTTGVLDRDWPLVQHSLAILWQRQSWPLKAMSHGHWSQVRAFFQGLPAKCTLIELPSTIKVSRSDERIVIEIGK